MNEFTLNAEARSDLGKGASRRLRRNAGMIPAIIYGGDKAPQSISLLSNEVSKLLMNEAAFSHVITLSIAGTPETVLIKALQRHPAKSFVMHVDFLRAVAGHKLTAHVPLHFVNADSCPGVKQQGGEVLHNLSEVEVSCQPQHLPEFIEVDMGAVSLNQTVHMSDLKLPQGVELVSLTHGSDLPVAAVHLPRVNEAAEESPAE